MTPEGKVKEKVKKVLKKYAHVYYFMPRGTTFGRSGVPDFIGCINGHFFSVETKAGKNTCTALQLLEIAHIRESGGRAFVVNDEPLTLEQLDQWLDQQAAAYKLENILEADWQ